MSTHKKPTLKAILSEASDVITSNSAHFSILSLAFLLPTSISILSLRISTPLQWRDPRYLLVVLFSVCAKASITCSASLAYRDRPVRIITSLKAIISHSFFLLLATSVFAQVGYGLVVFSFAGSTYSLFSFLVSFGLNADCKSYKGMRGTFFSILVLFSVISGVLSSLSKCVIADAGGRFASWEFLLQMTILTVLVTLHSLYVMATSAVLSMHCDRLGGEYAKGGVDVG